MHSSPYIHGQYPKIRSNFHRTMQASRPLIIRQCHGAPQATLHANLGTSIKVRHATATRDVGGGWVPPTHLVAGVCVWVGPAHPPSCSRPRMGGPTHPPSSSNLIWAWSPPRSELSLLLRWSTRSLMQTQATSQGAASNATQKAKVCLEFCLDVLSPPLRRQRWGFSPSSTNRKRGKHRRSQSRTR